MLVENQYFEKKWTKGNKTWYENKGYEFTGYSNKFIVRAEDLSKGAKDVVKVQCDYCGKIVDKVWRDYYAFINKKRNNDRYSCQQCRQRKTSEVYKEERISKQYQRALDFCQRNEYRLITPISKIDTCYSEMQYICPKHGLIKTTLLNLTQEHKCLKCSYEDVQRYNMFTPEYVSNLIKQHGGILINKEEYTGCMDKNLKVICQVCGDVFTTSLYAFLKHDGQRCPNCSNTESNGEFTIRMFLDEYRITNIPQYKFNDCRYKNPLPFDFYLPENNLLIEYDGQFHYEPICIGGIDYDKAVENYNNTVIRDKIKSDYCKKNNYDLLRIPYWDFNNINIILYNKLID